MLGQKAHHLTADLQIRHVPIQIDPIQTLQIHHHVPVEHIIHSRCRSHLHSLTTTEPPNQTPASAVRGEASLVIDGGTVHTRMP
jgi:glycerol-3-phosphate O-acyltransferase